MLLVKYFALLPVILFPFPGKDNFKKPIPKPGDGWSGTVSFYEKRTGADGFISEWRMDATFTNDTGTATHTSKFSTNRGSGHCINQAKSDLEVGIDDEKMTYSIMASVPGCYGTQTIDGETSNYPVTDETGIAINNQPLGTNQNVLTGRLVESTPCNECSVTTVYEWSLVRGPVDAELIITPSNYDNWMPEPGPDETTKGNVMGIELKVQKRNGGAPSLKAKAFEIRLNNTSKEPGITINAPLNPSGQLPDLGFLEQEDAVISEAGQFIRFPCDDGIKGEAEIASYDGGGWTMLTAEAILEGGIRIKGSLLVPTGTKEILIPKRSGSSKIAIKWLTANNNPADTDDKDPSRGNSNEGDGLTAYEEYRGVISEGKFLRLDPRKKELGIRMKKSEFPLFADGVNLFETASGIKVIRFYETEIDQDRKLNKNASTAHVYNQYAMNLENGGLAGDVVGENQPINIRVKTPEKSDRVIIDIDKIKQQYQLQEAALRAANIPIPYTQAENIANTIAHELAHGVNVNHHGESSNVPRGRIAYANSQPPYHIFGDNGIEITRRPFPGPGETLDGAGQAGNDESGDLNCIMAYTSAYQWAFRIGGDGSLIYHSVPVLPVGKKLCNSKAGTGINAGPDYFGNATFGNCLNQIKLRN